MISTDQALTAKVLKIANSPFYGFPRKISTIDFAIIVLGYDALKEIVISISLVSSLQRKSDAHFDAKAFWDHSILSGVLARRLARDLGYRVSGEVFVGGLLHDMGISVLHRYFKNEYQRITEIIKETDLTALEAEESVLGVTHADVGGWLAERWNLPNHLVEAITMHHTPGLAKQNKDLVALIHCADIFAWRMNPQPMDFDKGADFDRGCPEPPAAERCPGASGIHAKLPPTGPVRPRSGNAVRSYAGRVVIRTTMDSEPKKKNRLELLEEGLPQFEQFIESRETYIRALEKTIDILRQENVQFNQNSLAIRSSIDELVATQRLSNIISTATEPELIVSALIELTRQVIPVLDSNIFLFQSTSSRLIPLSSKGSPRLQSEAEHQLEAGIVDWVIAEKKTVIIPDLEHMLSKTSARNFVIVPLILRSQGIGIFIIHTEKSQQEFSNQDIQLLSVLANQAAVGVENWRTYQQLLKANDELKSSQAQMVQAAKLAAIGELAAGIAHEIKNPLQVLMLHMDLVQAGRPLPNWMDMFSKQLKRLSDITLRLMNFSRNASEEVTTEPIDVNKAIEDIVMMVQHEFEGNGIEIDQSLAQDLPSVGGNANYLQQVFLNLLINARDAMPKGGTIGVSTSLTGFHVCVKISDTGQGIEKDLLEKIFKPFFSTKGEKGTGLGLAICSKIIAQHKGEIRVESEVGKGTTFTIFLPVWRAPQ